ncbi:MAG: hypothetical protein KTR16_00495 [Acidiferrobacterales bacterium]|nr:hypothetical protein [Acidiferrobacterales bacterium]
MKNIVVLFNLQSGVDIAEYEQWAKATDLPIVNGLDSIEKFEVFKTTGLLGSEASAPYEYVELLTINDFDKFGAEVSSETMQKVATEFQGFADSPMFITLEEI